MAPKGARKTRAPQLRVSRQKGLWMVEDISTMTSMADTDTSPLDRVIRAAGGPAALARSLGVHRSAVTHWRRLGVPASQMLRLEAISGIKAADFRPDLVHAPENRGHVEQIATHEPASRPGSIPQTGDAP